jgi:hypothetical protein
MLLTYHVGNCFGAQALSERLHWFAVGEEIIHG